MGLSWSAPGGWLGGPRSAGPHSSCQEVNRYSNDCPVPASHLLTSSAQANLYSKPHASQRIKHTPGPALSFVPAGWQTPLQACILLDGGLLGGRAQRASVSAHVLLICLPDTEPHGGNSGLRGPYTPGGNQECIHSFSLSFIQKE